MRKMPLTKSNILHRSLRKTMGGGISFQQNKGYVLQTLANIIVNGKNTQSISRKNKNIISPSTSNPYTSWSLREIE